jgi:integrase
LVVSWFILGREGQLSMARTVKKIEGSLTSPSGRARLKSGRPAHWVTIIPGRAHLGWQRWKGDRTGRWLLRRYLGNDRYSSTTLGRDDALSYEEADEMARAMLSAPAAKLGPITVADAVDRYIEAKRNKGKPVADLLWRARVHIKPTLGDRIVSELTSDDLEVWLAALAATPAQKRPKAGGRPVYGAAATTPEATRARRASANRNLTFLRAALNHAFDKKLVASRDEWGRRLKPFEQVNAARPRYLTHEEAARLINAADPDFRLLVRAGLETGMRYGEIIALVVSDFHSDSKTIHVQRSKSGKSKDVRLTAEGAEFFRSVTAGRPGSERLFRRANGKEWKPSNQFKPMRAASAAANITPPVSFHVLRHTWASLAVMARMPLMVVAKNLGHRDTTMVEHFYGHLAKDYIDLAIHKHAPRYDVESDKKIVSIK